MREGYELIAPPATFLGCSVPERTYLRHRLLRARLSSTGVAGRPDAPKTTFEGKVNQCRVTCNRYFWSPNVIAMKSRRRLKALGGGSLTSRARVIHRAAFRSEESGLRKGCVSRCR